MGGDLTETVKAKVDPSMKAALVRRAEDDSRSVGSVIRAAIRSYLAKGKR